MLPDKCSIREGTKDCVNPPEFVITVVSDNDQFMLGLTCQKHKTQVLSKLEFVPPKMYRYPSCIVAE